MTSEEKKVDAKVEPEKPVKERKCRYRMDGCYKGEEKRRAYVLSAKSLMNVVDRFGGQPQIYRNDKWENLSKSELKRLVQAQKDAKEEARKAKIDKSVKEAEKTAQPS